MSEQKHPRASSKPPAATDMNILLRRAIIVFVLCAMVALLIAVEQYLTVGEYFALRDIMHHEAIAITILAFGFGFLLSTVYFAAYLVRNTRK